MSTHTTPLDIRPLSGHVGAEIFGVDLSRPLSPALVAAIRAALLEWKVVFFRDQHLTQDQHVSFGRQFGNPTPAHPTLPPAFPDHPEIRLIDNRHRDRTENDGADALRIENRWHTDMTFTPAPPMASILRALVTPERGGDTQWASLTHAYQRLSPSLRDYVDGLTAVHHNTLPISHGNAPSSFAAKFLGDGLRAVHPVVRVHPETGEKSLFVNPSFTSHIVEVSRAESRHLLALLYEHVAASEFTCRFRWEPGSIAFWDNRATVHLVPGDVPAGAHRSMQRITLAGDLPHGPNGFVSHALTDA
ncbi:TauD/TfdA dioxygenase family protein [Yinghuangia sp. YIM S09857]|uniref:TauD/TfdA dioxygenase family protein n=1 Tax=Yinghuangia sp. YIM S09857 TaxID=3436929 RepID=UPI003F5321A5